ncbi:hypothetical protein JTE90_027234 [Oedothorax gibbosus]|uniref:Uncharacterized protein n=1 Tax=Oedothorax gibbosus TaxID=931172 RepID=A0AAV6U2E9_9ARAC|nr:hypothetical protein JTE90_027234 [Oedothorax gibbosus]
MQGVRMSQIPRKQMTSAALPFFIGKRERQIRRKEKARIRMRLKRQKQKENLKMQTTTFEPEVVIKEEPIDTEEDHVFSRKDHELISPWDDSLQSGTMPTIGEVFTVIKTEPVDEDDEPQNNSNGNTKKASKGKAADVAQSESPSNEDSATKNSNAKDHFDVYGEYIAAKLRKLDWKSCAYVQKAFGDILFDAEMGKFK